MSRFIKLPGFFVDETESDVKTFDIFINPFQIESVCDYMDADLFPELELIAEDFDPKNTSVITGRSGQEYGVPLSTRTVLSIIGEFMKA